MAKVNDTPSRNTNCSAPSLLDNTARDHLLLARELCARGRARSARDKGKHHQRERDELVTALVPSEMACLESSPGRMRRTAVVVEGQSGLRKARSTAGGTYKSESRGTRWSTSCCTTRAWKPRRQCAQRCRCCSRVRQVSAWRKGAGMDRHAHKRVENEHGLVRDTSVGVDLLKDLAAKG
jgi:hypothetical protein